MNEQVKATLLKQRLSRTPTVLLILQVTGARVVPTSMETRTGTNMTPEDITMR